MEVHATHVLLQLNPSFDDVTNSVPDFHVRFTFSRIQMRRMHTAVDETDLDLIWPDEQDAVPLSGTGPTPNWAICEHTNFKPNDQQKQCIQGMLALSMAPRKRPFLLRGAFGTGKTSTLAQAVLQLLRSRSASSSSTPPHILLCTDCNAAADLYVLLLSEFGVKPPEMLRSYQARRALHTISSAVQPFCEKLFDSANQIFRAP